jgi:exosortase K
VISAGRANVVALAVSLALAAGAKQVASRGGPDDLRVLTAPTQALVTAATGVGFTSEPGYGYVSLDHHLVIAKSCAGVNHLAAVFVLLALTVVPAVRASRAKLLVLPALAAAAWAVTVAANALRLAVAMALHDGGVAFGWLDAARVHRLAGIVVYFASLVAAHAAARRLVARETPAPLVLVPLGVYLAVAIAAPLANGAYAARPRLFVENTAWIVAGSAAVVIAAAVMRRGASALGRNSPRGEFEAGGSVQPGAVRLGADVPQRLQVLALLPGHRGLVRAGGHRPA